MNLDLNQTCLVVVLALIFVSVSTVFVYVILSTKISKMIAELNMKMRSADKHTFDVIDKLKALIFKTLIFTVIFWIASIVMLITIAASKIHITDEKVLQTYEIEKITTTGLVFDGKIHVIGDNIQVNCEEHNKKNVVEEIQRTYYIQLGNIRLHNDVIVYAAYLEDEIYNRVTNPNLIWEAENE